MQDGLYEYQLLKKSLSSVRPSAPHRKLEILVSLLTIIFFFNDHVASIRKSSFYHLRNISYIRKHLSSTTTEKLVPAFVSSKLDYCNSLLYGLQNYQVKKVTARPERRCSSYLSFKKT